MRITSQNGYSVEIPQSITDAQIDAIRMVLHHGATTCHPAWAAKVSHRDDALRGAERQLRAAMADTPRDSTASRAIRAVLNKIEAA